MIPDTVSIVMWVTVGGATWEDGSGAAAMPVILEALESESVCQNALQLRCKGGGGSVERVHSVRTLSTSFKFVTVPAGN